MAPRQRGRSAHGWAPAGGRQGGGEGQLLKSSRFASDKALMKYGRRSMKHMIAIVWAALLALGTVQASTAQVASVASTWFAPYVDATLPPMYQVQNPSSDPARQTVFGFIVASRQSPCTPSWGDYYSLAQAAEPPLSLAAVVAAMEAEGEEPIISFGGESNTPLADACTSVSALEAAYSQVVATYHDYVVDFDIEGAAQSDIAGLERQAQALRDLQDMLAAQGKQLAVWLTLPVATTGMLPVAQNVVDVMLNAGVQLAGVNLMTMYFWPAPGDGAPMLSAVTSALESSEPQIARLFAAHGIVLSEPDVWSHMGATVQIGQESVPDEAFTVTDAQGLVGFARQVGLGRVSMWSINQDTPCGSAADPTVGGYSNYCSGVVQDPLAFDKTFSVLAAPAASTSLLGGSYGTSPTSVPPSTTTTTTSSVATSTVTSGSGAASSTYPTTTSSTPSVAPDGSYSPWSAELAYPAGSEVSYGGLVYRAKWWSQGEAPTTDVEHPWDTPWEVIGSVPSGGPPESGPAPWAPNIGYPRGSLVTYGGVVYEAKWWNIGDTPVPEPADPWAAPWELLSGNSSQPSATTTSGTTSTTLQASAGATTTTTGASAAQATTYSPWSSVVAYPGGSRVIYQGLVYQAKWWNEGEVPTVDVAHPWDTPWEPVGTAWPAG